MESVGARFDDCDLTDAQMPRIFAEHIQFPHCELTELDAPSTGFENGSFEAYRCDEALLDLAYFDGATLLDSSFQDTLFR